VTEVILSLIDSAVGCQECGGPLGESPSSDFCCEAHQQRWHAKRGEALVGSDDCGSADLVWSTPGHVHGFQPRCPSGDEMAERSRYRLADFYNRTGRPPALKRHNDGLFQYFGQLGGISVSYWSAEELDLFVRYVGTAEHVGVELVDENDRVYASREGAA
jgi:hypothetical protein